MAVEPATMCSVKPSPSVTRLRVIREDQVALAAALFLVVALVSAGIAAMFLQRTPTNAQGGMVGNCFSAWEVLVDKPPAQFDAGQEPPTTWSKPCRVQAHQLWLQARPWVAAALVAAVAAMFAWYVRRRRQLGRWTSVAALAAGASEG